MKQANTQILSFSERLKLVHAEVNKRVNRVPENRKCALQARLWCAWLRREVLL